MDYLTQVDLQQFYGKSTLKDLFDEQHQLTAKGFKYFDIENSFVRGKLIHADLADFVFCYQDWKLSSPFQLQVKHDAPLLKIQFELKGGSTFYDQKDEIQIDIPAHHHQVTYTPHINGLLTYEHSRESVAIHINKEFLIHFLSAQGFNTAWFEHYFSDQRYTFFQKAIGNTSEQETLIKDLIHHNFQHDFALDYIRCKSLELLLSVFYEASNKIAFSTWKDVDVKILKEIRFFIDQNLEKEYHLKDLANQFGINEFKLKKGFKDLYQETVFTYIRRKRMDKAHDLLLNTSFDIKEIAYMTGYKYAHHFTRSFFEFHQVLPKKIRQQGL